MLYGVFILFASVGIFWLSYRRPRPRRWLLSRQVAPRAVAAVDRQHRHLHAGGLLSETVCERTKARFRELLESDRADLIERELSAGLDFAVQVRALTELGTPDAARVLTRLIVRPLSSDPVEQAWYWVDLAAGLRRLGCGDALPAVLRCAHAASGSPQGALLAAEAVSFANFANVLRHQDRWALRALIVAGRAAREGTIDAAPLVRAGLGEMLADLTSRATVSADPWLTAAVIETDRHSRRLGHWSRFFPNDVRILAERQAVRLRATADRRLEWLGGAADRLLSRFPTANPDEKGVSLQCLFELRADVTKLFPHLPDRRSPWWADAVRALQWSRSPVVGPVLAGQAVRLARKVRHHGRAAILLTALRGHACYEAERVLLRNASATNLTLRHAAVRSLGWWTPFDPNRVTRVLRVARTDPDTGMRLAAVSALARLGERAALTEIAEGLQSEEIAIRLVATARIATEGLSWSWPDLETAAESNDADTAIAAAEALECLREQLFGFAR